MSTDGGDWTPEEPDKKANESNWMPLVLVLVAIGAFGIAMVTIAFARGMFDMATMTVALVDDQAHGKERAAERTATSHGEQLARDVSRHAQRAARPIGAARSDMLADELFDAAYGDFDAARRDEIARTLIKASDPGRTGDLLFDAGAHDVLLNDKPSSDAWVRAALYRRDWDRLAAAEPEGIATWLGGRGLCIAGAQGKALGVFKHMMQTVNSVRRINSDIVVACGGSEKVLGIEITPSRMSSDDLGVVASRHLDELERLVAKTSKNKSLRHLGGTLEAAAVLYVDGKLPADDLVELGSHHDHCAELPRKESMREHPDPQTLLEAADQLEREKSTDKRKSETVENLRVAAVLSGLSRNQDVRGKFTVSNATNQLCMAQAEYVFEPTAAVHRLEKLIQDKDKDKNKAKPNAPHPHLMLAMALARIGEFDRAFDAASTAFGLAKPNHGTHADAAGMLLAFGHKTGRLAEVDLGEIYPHIQAQWDALRGSDDDRRVLRINREIGRGLAGPSPVTYYLRGALAPGHEETFSDGLPNPNDSLAGYFWSRAEAARWRGDEATEAKWRQAYNDAFERAADGKFGGYHVLVTRMR